MKENNIFKSGFITIIGKPNVGKSTIINSLIGEKVAITSPKPQTTRSNLRAVITEKNYQMIFIDTPGIHTPKNKLGEYMVTSASSTFSEVDVIVMVCDATDRSLSKIDEGIIEKLRGVSKKPVFLVINKSDAVIKESILEKISAYSSLYDFKEIIPLSALKKEGIDLLKETILKYLKEGTSKVNNIVFEVSKLFGTNAIQMQKTAAGIERLYEDMTSIDEGIGEINIKSSEKSVAVGAVEDVLWQFKKIIDEK